MAESGNQMLRLPVIGQEYTPGVPLATYQFVVTTKNDVKEKLKQYGKPISGNQEEVIQRLCEFSSDEADWLSLFQPKLKQKRGEHTSQMSLSCKRIEDTFRSAKQMVTYKSKKGADHTQCALKDNDRTANTHWAKAVFKAFGMPADLSCMPSVPKRRCTMEDGVLGEDTSLPETLGSLQEKDSFAVRMCRVKRNVFSVRDDIYNIEGNLNNVASHVMDLKTLILNGQCSTLPPPVISVNTAPRCNEVEQPSSMVCAAQIPTVSAPLSKSRSLPHHKLGVMMLDGEWFKYDKTKVPEPPTIHFSQDIDRLCDEWESSNLLCIGGHRIPIKHWGKFYKRAKGVKSTAWDALRVEWGNLKFIAEERQKYLDNNSFWQAFSDKNGKNLSYQQLLNHLAEYWLSAAAQDANDARTFFHGNLNHPMARSAFDYTKAGKTNLSSKDDTIAKKWHELLAMRPDIVEQCQADQVIPPSSPQ
ncbi:hypothetical protein DFJ58DRAFT_843215 [Suillus subalutaceus]|uniref:uncharacterized protein n=1 Tax=Suillus subalutaceus TaxID=48586 RepID=UPI001B864E0F|nr:uncharacterized protein DFJ58DRAFT_843215 [Suillus subalutaceus]KAG1847320.1 hypothetical protein DFJ58DRAFT_843215 [Suillus subalutaceus]